MFMETILQHIFMKKIVYTLILGLLCLPLMAQQGNDAKKAEKARIAAIKKELDAAKINFKQQKNLDKTEATMRNLLKDSLNKNDIRIYQALQQSVILQYAQINEKVYLKQKYDSAQLYDISKRLFETTLMLDEVDAMPNAKGQSAPRYRKENSELLSRFVGNIYSGIIYHMNKQQWKQSVELSDLYLALPAMPFGINLDEKRATHAAYMNFYSSFKGNNYDMALKHSEKALGYTSRVETILQCLCEIHLSRGENDKYLQRLDEGMDAFPTSAYFFTHLADNYINTSKFDKALEVTHKALAANPQNVDALVISQTINLNLAHYDECIKAGEDMLARESELFNEDNQGQYAEVYYNMALAYYNQSLDIEQNVKNTRERNEKLTPIYESCRPYMERYRALAPDAKERWKPVLYAIYLHLNLGKEFAEIEGL